ncbi:DNA-binding transcriptional regulator, MerR family [Nocardioides sp. YR527]|uniref:MerR family transcriptional regulator n=1 Tax=Nocardioides sp. YR527 TaxID=1881028 RepID=UPI00088EB6E5|nr:MerR family transcriptional regulator [Nocardioides sp. YR527]SDJ88623.1 DNA-binding transcriptional regulator, MerR family [Nocardioides sp. YR527]
MDEPLLTIGAFARAVGLTASALRHYDECGLLVPAEVDSGTGYRYYTPELADRARLIVGMREAGVPIETMRVVLDSPTAQARAALAEFLEDQGARTARAEEAVRGVLTAVDAGPAARPALVELPGPVLAAAIRQVRHAAESDPASELASVLVDVDESGVDVVATNRYWMAVRNLPAVAEGDGGRAVLSLPDAGALADRLDAITTAELRIADGTLTLAGQELGRDTTYPAHRLVLAGLEPAVTGAVLAKADLLAGLDAAAYAEVDLFLEDRTRLRSPHAAEQSDVRGVVTGPPSRLRLGTALFGRALAACLGDEVQLAVTAPDRPVVVTSPYQPGFTALVMPVRHED